MKIKFLEKYLGDGADLSFGTGAINRKQYLLSILFFWISMIALAIVYSIPFITDTILATLISGKLYIWISVITAILSFCAVISAIA